MVYIDTKQIIVDATVRLMKSKEPKSLTVQKILDEAHISRATFYNFFADKYDVINYYFESYVEQRIKDKNEDDISLLEACAFNFIYDNKDYFFNAIKLEGQNSLKKFFYDYYYKSCSEIYLKRMNKKKLSREDEITISFYCMGSLHVLMEWLVNGAKESPEFMASVIHKLIPKQYWSIS